MKIYVSGRDSGEKDPTVQAVGIGATSTGRVRPGHHGRLVDHTNHQQFDSQINWIQNQVGSRVADAGGRMLLIGTRMETVDLYSEIRKAAYYVDGESPWTYLKQPAVLEYADDPKDWVTLWPETNRPPVSIAGRKVAEDAGWPHAGLWPMWHGPALVPQAPQDAGAQLVHGLHAGPGGRRQSSSRRTSRAAWTAPGIRAG
jgi:hypothetical protein